MNALTLVAVTATKRCFVHVEPVEVYKSDVCVVILCVEEYGSSPERMGALLSPR